jgi:hypothetical protein
MHDLLSVMQVERSKPWLSALLVAAPIAAAYAVLGLTTALTRDASIVADFVAPFGEAHDATPPSVTLSLGVVPAESEGHGVSEVHPSSPSPPMTEPLVSSSTSSDASSRQPVLAKPEVSPSTSGDAEAVAAAPSPSPAPSLPPPPFQGANASAEVPPGVLTDPPAGVLTDPPAGVLSDPPAGEVGSDNATPVDSPQAPTFYAPIVIFGGAARGARAR